MKAYQDKESGLWKWGKNGKPIYESKELCKRAGLDMLTDRLIKIRDKHYETVLNHGRG